MVKWPCNAAYRKLTRIPGERSGPLNCKRRNGGIRLDWQGKVPSRESQVSPEVPAWVSENCPGLSDIRAELRKLLIGRCPHILTNLANSLQWFAWERARPLPETAHLCSSSTAAQRGFRNLLRSL